MQLLGSSGEAAAASYGVDSCQGVEGKSHGEGSVNSAMIRINY
jgi:hypothetical protein